MNTKQNLHTHSTFCDGADTPKEMVEAAIEKGFGSIGFSGHSPMFYAPEHGMAEDEVGEYIKTVQSLKKEYEGKIDIYCGIEFDMYSRLDLSPFDYKIGSVHYLDIKGEYVGFDRSQQVVGEVIAKYFGGDGMAYAKMYYEALARLPEYGNFDIVGHFDLITKHCENIEFFDIDSKEYLSLAVSAAEALAGKIPLFEVNTGAIPRGYRTTPYPSVPIIKELKSLGFGAVITSDCHDAQKLDCNFSEAAELLRYCGFKEKYILTEKGFVAVALD